MSATTVSFHRRSISDLIDQIRADRSLPDRLQADSSREVVLDCGEIESVSSEDLNTLIRFYGVLRRESKQLVLANVSEAVAEVFSLTRLNRLFVVRIRAPHQPASY